MVSTSEVECFSKARRANRSNVRLQWKWLLPSSSSRLHPKVAAPCWTAQWCPPFSDLWRLWHLESRGPWRSWGQMQDHLNFSRHRWASLLCECWWRQVLSTMSLDFRSSIYRLKHVDEWPSALSKSDFLGSAGTLGISGKASSRLGCLQESPGIVRSDQCRDKHQRRVHLRIRRGSSLQGIPYRWSLLIVRIMAQWYYRVLSLQLMVKDCPDARNA